MTPTLVREWLLEVVFKDVLSQTFGAKGGTSTFRILTTSCHPHDMLCFPLNQRCSPLISYQVVAKDELLEVEWQTMYAVFLLREVGSWSLQSVTVVVGVAMSLDTNETKGGYVSKVHDGGRRSRPPMQPRTPDRLWTRETLRHNRCPRS